MLHRPRRELDLGAEGVDYRTISFYIVSFRLSSINKYAIADILAPGRDQLHSGGRDLGIVICDIGFWLESGKDFPRLARTENENPKFGGG
jgi:hypothetical protein